MPILAPRYWMVLLTGVLCWGAFTLVNWTGMSADPTGHPNWTNAGLMALKDAGIYLVFASVLFAIKRLVLSSTPRKPPATRR